MNKLDFVYIETKKKKNCTEVYPRFNVGKVSDIMIKGGDFYAIWNAEEKLWSTDERDAIELIDQMIAEYPDEGLTEPIVRLYLRNGDSGMIDKFHKYCTKQMIDTWKPLDEKITFLNTVTDRKDYVSKKVGYSLEKTDISAYERIMSVLYSPEERHKLEWAIGSIVAGDSKKIQKFIVLYGAAGTGKSTILDIISMLFEGYTATFSAKQLASNGGTFALEPFRDNPLVAIQHDGDLSRIEDNTRLNSLVSHELLPVNEKFKSIYTQKFNAFLFIGTNNPVKITDSKSGLLRRLIDVQPTGNLIPLDEYNDLMERIPFELGGIAYHCKEVYEDDKKYYNSYKPILMMGETNDFYNFILEYYDKFSTTDPITKKIAWAWYKEYIEDARVPYPYSLRAFKNELKNYFEDFKERTNIDGVRCHDVYYHFNLSLVDNEIKEVKNERNYVINLNTKSSLFDILYKDCPAQYAVITKDGRSVPEHKWAECKTKLSDLETWKTHYVKVPENLIVIDFDLKNSKGEKDLEANLKAASKWPKTYAETSNSGNGIHLHYIYEGDVTQLDSQYADGIEVKVYTGGSALRRRVVWCNDIPVATLSSGLPLKKKKGEHKMVNADSFSNETTLRRFIESCIDKTHHGHTAPEINYIHDKLEECYESGMNYDVTDMRNAILTFAMGSSNQSGKCISLVADMKFKSKEQSENVETVDYKNLPIIFFDIEIFPNLFLCNYKTQGTDKCVRMINPSAVQVHNFINSGRLVGFNNRRYDNHILYAASIGYSNEELYELSKKIITTHTGFFGEAYNISYTDIYDYSSKKQSLKQWEIDLGIHHMELGFDWDQPVPEDKWKKVAEYCDNDVFSTEAVWDATQSDFIAREMLADIAGMTVNDTSNSITTRIIFGNNKKPKLIYTDLATGESSEPLHNNYINAFPGYEFKKLEGDLDDGKYHNIFRGVDVGKGGYVYAEPGIYSNVALLDVASMHPHSILAMEYFGEYTQGYADILQLRIDIKHKNYDKAKTMFDGKLAKYLNDDKSAKALSKALKIPLNSCYGLTSASFDNPFKDPRNANNIVALRGALFMKTLQDEVTAKGFKVCHIKTDSIKIPNATPDIIKFCMDFAKDYGYEFEHEATYNRICLVNDAVYIAKYESPEKCMQLYGYVPGDNAEAAEEGHYWTATGTEFQVPYIFKTLFTHEPIEFNDFCETKSVMKGAIYIDMNEDPKFVDVTAEEKIVADCESLQNAINRFYTQSSAFKRSDDISSDKKLVDKIRSFERKYNIDLPIYDNLEEKLADFKAGYAEKVAKGHNYIFVGRVGQFCPIRDGMGGGELYRKSDDKYAALAGTKGWRWLESEIVKTLGKEDAISTEYWKERVEEAKNDISKYGDFDFFVSDEDYLEPDILNPGTGEMAFPVYKEEMPFL